MVTPAPSNPPALTPGPPWSCPKESKGKSHLPMSTLPAWRGRKSPGAREGATLWMFEENLSCRGSCTSCRCKFWDVSGIREQTELGEDGKEEQSRRVEQRPLVTSGMHQTQKHMETTFSSHCTNHNALWLLLASFRFWCGFPREDPLADVSV